MALLMRAPRGWRVASVGATALALACGGSDSTAPQTTGTCGTTPTGVMTASVNGAAFSATFITQATIQNSTTLGPNIVQINGAECPVNGVAGRQILITLGRLTPITPGTYNLDPASQGQPSGSGYSGIGQYVLAPNLWYSNLSDATGPGSGSITFTTVSATRLVGTFQLVTVPAGANGTTARQRTTITNGVFNIPTP
jgi:hypothetical protein